MLGLESGWLWAIAGVLLLAVELVAPGFFFFFIGVAALATGVLTLSFGLGTPAQVLSFALLAALSVYVGRKRYSVPGAPNLDPLLNDRGGRLVGRTVEVIEPVSARGGRVRVGDSVWSARGKPAAAGSSVRVTGIDGNCLTVEPVEEIEA